jgi:hypothetical protein
MTTIDNPISELSQEGHGRQLRRALVASTVGTTIEWYDFLLYGQVTGLVFGKLFFPQSDPIVGVLQARADHQGAPSGRSTVQVETTSQRAINTGLRASRPIGPQTACAANNLAGGANPSPGGRSFGRYRAPDDA